MTVPATSTNNQSWWKVFAKPSWIILALCLLTFSVIAFVFLAPWQLNKDDEIVERNERIHSAYEQDPVPIEQILDNNGAITADEEWRRVSMSGRYLPDQEMLLRLRPIESTSVFQSVVPFELDSGMTILVNRGYQVAERDNSVPHIPAPSGDHITTVGMLRFSEPVYPAEPIDSDGYLQLRSINSEQISELTGLSLADDIIEISTADQPDALNPIPVPQLERGSHLSYGFQWIAFGIMAPAGLGYFIWAEIRERRRENEEHADLTDTDSASGLASDDTDAKSSSEATPVSPAEATKETGTRSRRLRDRYGGDKPDHYAKIRRRRQQR